MDNSESKESTEAVDPLVQLVHDELRKSGTRIWLGPAPPEEKERFGEMVAERDFQVAKRQLEDTQRRSDERMRRAREAFQRKRGEQS
jgi:hypothetical protein